MWYSHLVKLDKYKVHLVTSGNVVKRINSDIFNKLFWYNVPEAKWASTLHIMHRSPSIKCFSSAAFS